MARVEQSSAGSKNSQGDSDGIGDHTKLLSATLDFEGTSALYQALARIDQAELMELLQRSKKISSPNHRLYVQRAIFQRFASLNPQEALRHVEDIDWQHRDTILERIFAEWSISDLDAAVTSIGRLDNKLQKVALDSLLSTRDDLSDSYRLDLARSFGAEELAARLMNESQTFEYLEDPEAAWNALISDGFDPVSQLDLAAGIATQWIEQSGFEVLPRVMESITGKYGYNILLEGLIDSATESDPRGLLDFAVGLDGSRREYVLNRISYTWSRTDPFAAAQVIAASRQSQGMSSNLQMILQQWARSNPQEIFDKRSLLPRHVQLEGLGYALAEIAKKDPDQALHQMAVLEDEWTDASTLLQSLVSGWAEADPHAALEWASSNSSELGTRFPILLSDILAKLVLMNPQEAFAIALSHATPFRGEGMEVRLLIRTLCRTNLSTAVDLLPQVRDEWRSTAYWHVSYALIWKGQSRRALELAYDLPEFEQENHFDGVLSWWASVDLEDLFREIEGLPSVELKALAAFHLINNHEGTPVLTKEQLDHAETFLNERELNRMRDSQRLQQMRQHIGR